MLKPEIKEGLDRLIELAYLDQSLEAMDYWIFGLYLRWVRWCFRTKPRFWGLIIITNTVLIGVPIALVQWLFHRIF